MSEAESISIDQFPTGCLVSDGQRRILYANRYIQDHFGYRSADLVEVDLFTLLNRASQIMYETYLVPLLEHDGYFDELRLTLQTAAGESCAVMVSARCEYGNGTRIYWSVSSAKRSEQLFQELTEARALLEQKNSLLHNLAEQDYLTGIRNRDALTRRLEQIIATGLPGQQTFALAFIDLDGFKAINDDHGHAAGDQLLRQVAERMSDNLRSNDLLARFGGDEFILLLQGAMGESMIRRLLGRLLEEIARPFEVDGVALSVSASIGVTVYPQATDIEPDQLIRQADQAMYEAKRTGRNQIRFFNVQQAEKDVHRRTEIDAISDAITDNQFELYYQPKVDMRSGEVMGAEALIRRNHPEHGLQPPSAFLPLLDGTETGITLGQWVVRRAVEQIREWRRQGIDMHVSVNIAGYHLQHPDFLEHLRATLTAFAAVPNNRLELEVLESSAIEDVGQAARVLQLCRMMGVKVSLDDFGTGYSTLGHLRDLPLDTLKIDRRFVQTMLTDDGDRAILRGVIGFAGAFDCGLIAEGVETIQHAGALMDLGCLWGQGYYIARPMRACELLEWVERWRQSGFVEKFGALHEGL
ncbi:EAL domain-containing protein [Spiribacter vilamensis]|uniref:Diguanylate cyclase (GGDEF)-like protein n=2 Tax=Spiribacter vilamensis TaxID=531306 RepID=A0A4Q8D0F6_9GAMM|nr:diguanylate cyclase (GGDEF)-like protein [Spiribacter vilamensis]TVO62441.1 EAL domain-containing protein [Spiribacter vilamensis]